MVQARPSFKEANLNIMSPPNACILLMGITLILTILTSVLMGIVYGCMQIPEESPMTEENWWIYAVSIFSFISLMIVCKICSAKSALRSRCDKALIEKANDDKYQRMNNV